jgi:hypothetical protein
VWPSGRWNTHHHAATPQEMKPCAADPLVFLLFFSTLS